MTQNPKQPQKGWEDAAPSDYLAVGLAWLIPGSGHIAIGQTKRGVIFAITLHTLFFLGLFIGGLRAIRPEEQPIWAYTQFMAGWPMLAANFLQKTMGPISKDLPRIHDVGAVYCGIAGMLNLLVIFDLIMRIGHAGKRPEHLNEPQKTEGQP